MVNLDELKVSQLKSFAKNLKVTGYSRLRKDDLVALISKHFKQKNHKKKFLSELKIPQLRSFAKNLKLTGYRRLSKDDLVALISKQFKQKKHKKKFLSDLKVPQLKLGKEFKINWIQQIKER